MEFHCRVVVVELGTKEERERGREGWKTKTERDVKKVAERENEKLICE